MASPARHISPSPVRPFPFAPSPLHQHVTRVLQGEAAVVLHFQPIVDLARGHVTGFEALARFPGKEQFTPDRVIEAARQIGDSIALEALLVSKALASRARLPQNCFLTINMSAAFLLSDEWRRLSRELSGLGGVVLELTEQEAISDYERVRAELARVQRAGGMVAVDDAGAGYASLKHVLEIKPNFIKLDRIFVQDCHGDPAKGALIEMIGRAGSRMDSWIIAEGIETPCELGELCRLGVPLGQGYLLGRPHPVMPETTVIELPGRQERAELLQEGSLAPHVISCATFTTPEDARRGLQGNEAMEIAAVVDSFGRPVALLEHHPHLGLRMLPSFMCSQIASEPTEVLRRALTRPASTRFDPFAVIDTRGIFQGVVPIDRLMRGVLPDDSPLG